MYPFPRLYKYLQYIGNQFIAVPIDLINPVWKLAGVDQAADAGIEVVATKVEEVAVAGAEKVEGLVGGLVGGVGGLVGGASDAAESAEASADTAVESVVDEAAKVVEAIPAVSVEVRELGMFALIERRS